MLGFWIVAPATFSLGFPTQGGIINGTLMVFIGLWAHTMGVEAASWWDGLPCGELEGKGECHGGWYGACGTEGGGRGCGAVSGAGVVCVRGCDAR